MKYDIINYMMNIGIAVALKVFIFAFVNFVTKER